MHKLLNYLQLIGETFSWKKKWDSVLSGSIENADVKWFDGGELNITENCLDRHLEERSDKVALIFEPNDPNGEVVEYTYKQLHEAVSKSANMIKDLGVRKGDRVCFYMSMVPELLIGVLATARIGAVHSVVFGGFSADALAARINSCRAKVVITADGSPRGGHVTNLKSSVNDALSKVKHNCKCLCVRHTGQAIVWQKNDYWLHELEQNLYL